MEVAQDPWERLVACQQPPTPIAGLALADGPQPIGGSGSDGFDGRAPIAAAKTTATSVPRLSASQLTYTSFCLEFLEPNLPLLIEGATEGWHAADEWVAPGGTVDLDFLERQFGEAQVAVTDTARRHDGCGPCRQMRLADYLAWWRQQQRTEEQQQQPAQQQEQQADEEQQQQQGQGAGAQSPADKQQQQQRRRRRVLLYCKDWHLASEFPDYHAYTCPLFFSDDWLNEWFDAQQGMQRQEQQQQQQQQQHQQGHPQQQQQHSHHREQAVAAEAEGRHSGVTTADYRFVYMGPKGTSTPLHADVLRSFSWSANIAGRKLWKLLPPQYSHLVLDRHGHGTAWDFSQPDPEGMYPGLAEARQHLLTVEQQPGEALFVPSGWFHTVENLDDCASINHNWLNGHNCHWAWALLQQERRQAEWGIEDCRELCSPAEFEGLVQRNLGANAGMDYAGLGALLRCIAERSLRQLDAAAAAAGAGVGEGVQAAAAAGGDGMCGSMCGKGSKHAATCSDCGCCCGGNSWEPGSRWYHTFRLQRAWRVLQELLAVQQQIDNSCRQAQQQGRHAGAGEEQLPHAAEVSANRACLARIEEVLQTLGASLL